MLGKILKKLSKRQQRGKEKLSKFRSKIPGIGIIDKQYRQNMQGIEQINNSVRPANQQKTVLFPNNNVMKKSSINISNRLQSIPRTPRMQEYTPEGKIKVPNDIMGLDFGKKRKSQGFK
jgi:hypothetical protein